ncbi:MAG: SDR family oxidoreductase [Clostridiales bacterium]|nr:SDR family oxidoreductase [Clostridiales bacterium]
MIQTDKLDGKVVVITGGAGVLGKAFCKGLGAQGAKIAILDLNIDAANDVAKELADLGYTASGFECNVLKKDSIQSARDAVIKKYGTCDILINGAGGNHSKGTTSKDYYESGDEETKEGIKSFFDLDASGVEFVFNLNFLGTLLPTQVFAKDMLDKDDVCIINISSMNAFTPLTRIPAYSGAKAAISNFTQWLAVHFSKTNIRVNAIAPGFFETAQNKKLLRNDDNTYTERANKIINSTPMSRFGNPEELIGTLLFLTDAQASGFVTGIVIPVDGGFSAYSGV